MLNTLTHRPAVLPTGHRPVLCIVVDTEEEFNWAAPFSRESTGVNSIASQRLAHERVYDRLGIVPTYVVDWPVATTPQSITTMKGLLDEGRCHIGTHLHPWVSPPHIEEVNTFNSYTGNLPTALEFEKLSQLTQAIAQNFGKAPIVFKAGRYGLGPHTSAAMQRLGYRIDASVVPHTTFTSDGGPDFSGFNNQAYWFGPTTAPLLELPVTTGFCGFLKQLGPTLYPIIQSPMSNALHIGGVAARTGALERIRLTPEGIDATANKRLMRTLVQAGVQVLTLTYHSPSLVPGNTPYVRTAVERDRFLTCIAECCNYFRDELAGEFMAVQDLRDKMWHAATHPQLAAAHV